MDVPLPTVVIAPPANANCSYILQRDGQLRQSHLKRHIYTLAPPIIAHARVATVFSRRFPRRLQVPCTCSLLPRSVFFGVRIYLLHQGPMPAYHVRSRVARSAAGLGPVRSCSAEGLQNSMCSRSSTDQKQTQMEEVSLTGPRIWSRFEDVAADNWRSDHRACVTTVLPWLRRGRAPWRPRGRYGSRCAQAPALHCWSRRC